MSDPARLLSGEANDFEKELLGSWGTEQPSDASRARVLAMVGVGAAAGAAAVAGKVGAAAGSSIAPKVGATGAAAIAKWILVGAVGVATAGATFEYAHRARQDGPTASPTSAPATMGPKTPRPSMVPTETPAPQTNAPTSAPPSMPDTTRTVAPPRRAAGTGAHANDPGLGEQVSALDRARRALGDGDASGALRQLDDYETRFPHGALGEEAEVLRVESLLAEGDRASAARVGSRFLATHPDSPHAARVRALLGQAPSP